MLRRIITAIIMLTIVILSFSIESLRWMVVVMGAAIGLLCTVELGEMMRRKGLRVYRRVAIWGVLALMIDAYFYHLQYAILIFGLAVCLAWIVRLRGQISGAWADVSATVFTMAYVGIPMAAITSIFVKGDAARAWLLLALSILWTSDAMALFFGRAFGRTRLWPKISPGKTWEGAIGGMAGAVMVVAIAKTLFPNYFDVVGLLEAVVFGILFSLIGMFGDLAESLLKRDVGVKDSGSTLTGHGGFLDLMDAVLFAAVPLLVYLMALHPNTLTLY